MRRCTECILPETFRGIELDEDGRCNFCHSFEKLDYTGGEAALDEHLARHRGNPGKYDVIVGISGGRDSAYALYYAVRAAGLRVLACTVDNGMAPPQAKLNIANMVEALGVDHIVVKDDLRRILTGNLRAWARQPSLEKLQLTCSLCNLGVLCGIQKQAAKHGIHLILSGNGGLELRVNRTIYAEINPGGEGRTFVKALTANPLYLTNPLNLIRRVELTFPRKPFEAMPGLLRDDILFLPLFNFIEHDEARIHSAIERELGWKMPPKIRSPWRFDCEYNQLKNHLLYRTYGFSAKDDLLSLMVRQGVLSRPEALRRSAEENVIPEELLLEFCNRIGIGLRQLEGAAQRMEL